MVQVEEAITLFDYLSTTDIVEDRNSPELVSIERFVIKDVSTFTKKKLVNGIKQFRESAIVSIKYHPNIKTAYISVFTRG